MVGSDLTFFERKEWIKMKKMTKSFRETVLGFVVVHSLLVGLFAGMAYFTVKFLFFPASWPIPVF